MSITKTEPVALAGAVSAVGVALNSALVGFEVVHWTAAQQSLILALFASVIALVTAVARSRVTPVAEPAVSVPLTQAPPTVVETPA